MHRSRPAACLLGGLVMLLAGVLLVVPPASASPTSASPTSASPTFVQDVFFPVGPYARVGWVETPVAHVRLNVPASGDTTVAVASSNTDVATVPASVVVPAGQDSAPIPVTALSLGDTTLSVSLGSQTLVVAPDLHVGGPSESGALEAVGLERSSLEAGESTTGSVALDFLAGSGGTTVQLSTSDPTVTVPHEVVVAADHGQATFIVLTQPVTSGTATITATAGEVTRTVEMSVVDTVAPDTTITGGEVRHRRRLVRVEFVSDDPGATFRCRLDDRRYKACLSPKAYRELSPGRHVVRVKATDLAGNVDPTPASATFRIHR